MSGRGDKRFPKPFSGKGKGSGLRRRSEYNPGKGTGLGLRSRAEYNTGVGEGPGLSIGPKPDDKTGYKANTPDCKKFKKE